MLDATESSNKRRVVGQFSFSANQKSENNVEPSIWRGQDAFLTQVVTRKGGHVSSDVYQAAKLLFTAIGCLRRSYRVPLTKLTSRRPKDVEVQERSPQK